MMMMRWAAWVRCKKPASIHSFDSSIWTDCTFLISACACVARVEFAAQPVQPSSSCCLLLDFISLLHLYIFFLLACLPFPHPIRRTTRLASASSVDSLLSLYLNYMWYAIRHTNFMHSSSVFASLGTILSSFLPNSVRQIFCRSAGLCSPCTIHSTSAYNCSPLRSSSDVCSNTCTTSTTSIAFFVRIGIFFPVSLACCLSPIPSRFQRKPSFFGDFSKLHTNMLLLERKSKAEWILSFRSKKLCVRMSGKEKKRRRKGTKTKIIATSTLLLLCCAFKFLLMMKMDWVFFYSTSLSNPPNRKNSQSSHEWFSAFHPVPQTRRMNWEEI